MGSRTRSAAVTCRPWASARRRATRVRNSSTTRAHRANNARGDSTTYRLRRRRRRRLTGLRASLGACVDARVSSSVSARAQPRANSPDPSPIPRAPKSARPPSSTDQWTSHDLPTAPTHPSSPHARGVTGSTFSRGALATPIVPQARASFGAPPYFVGAPFASACGALSFFMFIGIFRFTCVRSRCAASTTTTTRRRDAATRRRVSVGVPSPFFDES